MKKGGEKLKVLRLKATRIKIDYKHLGDCTESGVRWNWWIKKIWKYSGEAMENCFMFIEQDSEEI